MLHSFLKIFISSSSDLQSERGAAERVLTDLNIDGSRFESWASSPNPPLEECIEQITESDAVILILGEKYGNMTPLGISATHAEFRNAIEINKPIFVFILDGKLPEQLQKNFIMEVERTVWRGAPIKDENDLAEKIRNSLLQEFTRCFKEVHTPPQSVNRLVQNYKTEPNIELPKNPEAAFYAIKRLFDEGQDVPIHKLAPVIELHFKENNWLLFYMFMAEVNLGMNGYHVDENRVNRAIEFWTSDKSKEIAVKYSLDYNIGNAYSVLKKNHKAIKKFKESLEANPKFAECWKNLGTSYLEMGEAKLGRECIDKALELEPFLYEALYSSGTLALTQEKNPELALSYLNRINIATLRNNQAASVLSWKAYAFLIIGKYDEGIVFAEEAIFHAPELVWTWSITGRLYSLLRRKNEKWLSPSLDFWKRYTTKYSKEKDGWAELGFVYWMLCSKDNSYEEDALASFQQALELGYEDDGLAFDRMGHIYQKRNDWQKANKYYEKAAKQSPDKFGYCYGTSFLFLEKYDEALPWLKTAAESHRSDALDWSQLASCYIKLAQFELAEKAYLKAIEIEPSCDLALFHLGGLYWNRREYQKAKTIWIQAIKQFPDHELVPQARERLKLIR